MAIEITFLSVVLRKSSLERLDPELQALAEALFRWEPDWFREDEQLCATSFMCPADVRAFGTALRQRTSLMRTRDWAVVDMTLGPLAQVQWLEFQGGLEQISGAWLLGTAPGSLVRTPFMLPGDPGSSCSSRKVVKLFGRDSNHDAECHREDFGRFLPDWGGKDLWLVQVEPIDDGKDGPPRERFASMEAGATDFKTLQPNDFASQTSQGDAS